MIYHETVECRACEARALDDVLDMGMIAISDFVDDDREPDRAPLTLVQCRRCALVQLRHSVERDRLYRRYFYRSGINETMVAALRNVVGDALRQVDLQLGDAVLDIGSNDGTLLRQYPSHVRRYGVEPSDLWADGLSAGEIVHDYFPTWALGEARFDGRFKVITAIAMFYDLDDPHTFLGEVKRLLHPEGVFVVQFQDLDSMIRANAFDNICHEHVAYWDAPSLQRILAPHGLKIAQISRHPVNGGSLRLVCRHTARHEYAGPVLPPTALAQFKDEVERNRGEVLAHLHRFKSRGASIYGYAASTKANTLLQYYGIGPDLITAFAERSPDKWGKQTVATGIPIISEAEMRAARPDYLFVGAWQFANAFLAREKPLLDAGTRFIVPLPTVQIVGGDGADLQSQDAAPVAVA